MPDLEPGNLAGAFGDRQAESSPRIAIGSRDVA
jgi:hypothetical protein